MRKILLALLFVAPYIAANEPTALQHIINGKHRSAEHKQRDQYRHPEQTLAFFDVKDTMTVVEISPGKEGWYTEILAPYLRDKGKLYAAHFSPGSDNPFFKSSLDAFLDKIHKHPKLYDKVEITVLDPPKEVQIAPNNSADRVLTFRNVHNWMKNDQAPAVFNAMFKALKPGGILGIVEHRGSILKPQDPKAVSGYVTEDYVIALARKAGFEFLAKSEINANPKDTKNYPEGVWTLPPTLKLKEEDKDKYLAIGESDRMTIKFIKPQPKTIASFLPKALFTDVERASLADIPAVIHNSK
ncbi:MAG: methyltransferase [Methyloglobulus sp.]